MRAWMLLLITSLVVPGCVEKESDFFAFLGLDDGEFVPGQGDIFGRVTVDGERRSGVTVTVRRGDGFVDTTTTDAGGDYEFINLDPGTYTVSISSIPDAQCPGPQTAVVPADGDVRVDFPCTSLPTTGTVTGTVTSNGTPIEGATVTLSGPVTDTTVTDASGNFRFDDVDPGTYDVTASAGGFTCQPRTTTVAADQTSNVDIPCTPAVPTGTQIAGGYRLDGVGVSNSCSFGIFPQPGETVANPGPIEVQAMMEGGETIIVIVSDTEMEGVLNNQTGAWSGMGQTPLTPPLVLEETTRNGTWQFDDSGTVVYDSNAELVFTVFDDAGTPGAPSDDSMVCEAVVGDVQYTRIGDFVAPSSARFKRDVRALLPGGATLFGLRPVVFRYVIPYGDPAVPHLGLIAEEVAEVFPGAVALDSTGSPWGIRYDALTRLVIGEIATRIGHALEGGIERLANGR